MNKWEQAGDIYGDSRGGFYMLSGSVAHNGNPYCCWLDKSDKHWHDGTDENSYSGFGLNGVGYGIVYDAIEERNPQPGFEEATGINLSEAPWIDQFAEETWQKLPDLSCVRKGDLIARGTPEVTGKLVFRVKSITSERMEYSILKQKTGEVLEEQRHLLSLSVAGDLYLIRRESDPRPGDIIKDNEDGDSWTVKTSYVDDNGLFAGEATDETDWSEYPKDQGIVWSIVGIDFEWLEKQAAVGEHTKFGQKSMRLEGTGRTFDGNEDIIHIQTIDDPGGKIPSELEQLAVKRMLLLSCRDQFQGNRVISITYNLISRGYDVFMFSDTHTSKWSLHSGYSTQKDSDYTVLYDLNEKLKAIEDRADGIKPLELG